MDPRPQPSPFELVDQAIESLLESVQHYYHLESGDTTPEIDVTLTGVQEKLEMIVERYIEINKD